MTTSPAFLRRLLFGATLLTLTLLPRSAAAQEWIAASRGPAGDTVFFNRESIERQRDGSVEVWTRYNDAANHEYSVLREAYTCHGWTRLLYMIEYTLSGTVIRSGDVAPVSSWERVVPGTLEDHVGSLVCVWINRQGH